MEDDLKTKHNEMINNIINKCHDMIRNRHYMNDFAIKCYAEDIIQIVNYYHIDTTEPKWSENDNHIPHID